MPVQAAFSIYMTSFPNTGQFRHHARMQLPGHAFRQSADASGFVRRIPRVAMAMHRSPEVRCHAAPARILPAMPQLSRLVVFIFSQRRQCYGHAGRFPFVESGIVISRLRLLVDWAIPAS